MHKLLHLGLVKSEAPKAVTHSSENATVITHAASLERLRHSVGILDALADLARAHESVSHERRQSNVVNHLRSVVLVTASLYLKHNPQPCWVSHLFGGGTEAHLRVPLLLWVACRKVGVVSDTLAGVERNPVTLGARHLVHHVHDSVTAIDAGPPTTDKSPTARSYLPRAINKKHQTPCLPPSASVQLLRNVGGPLQLSKDLLNGANVARATNQAECTLALMRGQRLLDHGAVLGDRLVRLPPLEVGRLDKRIPELAEEGLARPLRCTRARVGEPGGGPGHARPQVGLRIRLTGHVGGAERRKRSVDSGVIPVLSIFV